MAMYTYLDYLSENRKEYIKALMFLGFFSALFSIALIISLDYSSRSLEDFSKIKISVKNISRTNIQVTSGTTFKKFTMEEILRIESQVDTFYVNYLHQNKWNEILTKIKNGDKLTLYYWKRSNINVILQLEKGQEKIFTINTLITSYRKALYVLVLLLIIFNTLIVSLMLKYRKLNGGFFTY